MILTDLKMRERLAPILEEVGATLKNNASKGFSRVTTFKKFWEKTNLFWVAVVVADIGFQASKRADMSQSQLDFLGTCF
jgi:hypothetical protein